MKRFATLIWMPVLLLAVAATAVFHLDRDPLYLDEGITIEHPGSALEVYTLAETSASIARFSEQHSPGYFWLMNGWSAMVGFSPFALSCGGRKPVAAIFAFLPSTTYVEMK